MPDGLGIEVTDLAEAHLDAAVELSTSVSWLHRREDWELLLSLSEGRVALLDGAVVGTALRADFGPDLSCVNMVIVAEDMRGQGVGRDLLTSVMQTRDTRGFRLVATASGQPLYEKLGFEVVSHIVQIQGVVGAVPDIPGVKDAQRSELRRLVSLDRDTFGGDRSALIAWLFRNARVATFRESSEIVGYAALRRFGLGYVIGPVVAPNDAVALALVAHLAQGIPGAFLRLDVAETSGLVGWLEGLGLKAAHRAPIMQRGDGVGSSRSLALFSQALG